MEEIAALAEQYGDWDDFGRWTFQNDDKLLAFVHAVQEAEREACARVCEEIEFDSDAVFYSHEFAEAIRARGSDLAKVGEVGVWGEEKNT
jgi:mannitol-1-phosphate/altronate dehydrogenase